MGAKIKCNVNKIQISQSGSWRRKGKSRELQSWANVVSSLYIPVLQSLYLISSTVDYQSDNLGSGTVTQESKYVPSLWNNFLSFRGGLHVAWYSVGFKASEAFHSVSFPPWNPWISHITSYCPCQAVAHLATALFCPRLLLWLNHGQHTSSTVKTIMFFPLTFSFAI